MELTRFNGGCSSGYIGALIQSQSHTCTSVWSVTADGFNRTQYSDTPMHLRDDSREANNFLSLTLL